MTSVEFVCEVPPLSINRTYRVVKFGKRAGLAKTPEANAYQQHVRAGAAVACKHPRPFFPKGQKVIVHIDYYWPTERGDVDSPGKLTQDAMNGVVFADDRQVKRLVQERHTDRKRPRVEIRVEPYERAAAVIVPFPKFLSWEASPDGLHFDRPALPGGRDE